MFHNRMTRGALALALGAGVLGVSTLGVTAIGESTVASASTPPLICHKIFGHITTKVTIAKCGVAQKGATFAGADILTGGTLTWGKTRMTTSYTGTATSPGQGACGSGKVEYDFTGTVTADTSTYVSVGDTVTYDVCVATATNVVHIVKRTTASF
jgi:hypothetical protein